MNITWTLGDGDANAILGLLGKCPYEQVSELIVSLRSQMAEQQKAAALAAKLAAQPQGLPLSNGKGEHTPPA